MSGDREAMSEQSSSVCKGAGYDEVFLSMHEPKEDLTRSPEREPSAHSSTEREDEEYGEDEKGEGNKGEDEEGEKGEDEEEEGEGDKWS